MLVPVAVVVYYWFPYGGTFFHRNKPEWDEVPSMVRKDEAIRRQLDCY